MNAAAISLIFAESLDFGVDLEVIKSPLPEPLRRPAPVLGPCLVEISLR